MSRTKKVLLAFNHGELSPHLDGRLDLYQANNALRTCQNMLVDREGGVRRRPGTRFIATAASGIEFSYVSYAGEATYYGITEFADVSDPPRKYRTLAANNASFRRTLASYLPVGLAPLNRTNYDTSGVRQTQIVPWVEVADWAPWGSTTGEQLDTPGDSLESTQWQDIDTPWENTDPTWTKERISKYFDSDAFGTPGAATFEGSQGLGVGRLGGLVTSVRGLGIIHAWNGGGWTLTLRPWSQDGFGAGNNCQVYARFTTGDRDPGTAGVSDYYCGAVTGQFGTLTLYLPPDTSVRFYVARFNLGIEQSGSIQVPQQITEVYANGLAGASGLTEDAFDRWFHFAATEGAQPAWRFEEKLGQEDTLLAALLRSSGTTIGFEPAAATTSLSGGTAAESNLPIDWLGRIVVATRLIGGLTIGHRYSVTATVRSNDIGDTNFTTTTEAGEEFTAQATSTQVSHTLRAGLGKEKRILNLTVDDLGTDPDPTTYDADTMAYWGRVVLAGGSLTAAELAMADGLVVALKAAGLWSKLCYFLPMLGGFSGMLVPLRDRDGAGNATNTAFVSGDYALATGLTGNGTSKRLLIPRNASEAGSSNNGGLGYWELNFLTGGLGPIGASNTANTNSYEIGCRDTLSTFRWGSTANGATVVAVPTSGYFHGRRSSATSRTLFKNGVSVATNTTNDATSGANQRDLGAVGANWTAPETPYDNGRCGCALITDGTESNANVLTLYEILRDELMTPSGRI